MDWNRELGQECDRARSDADKSLSRFAVTVVSLATVLSIGLSTAEVRGVSFKDVLHYAPWWVGIQVIAMGVSLLYKSYESGVAPILRQALKRKEKPLMTPVRLLDSAVYFLMFLSCTFVFLADHSVTVYLFFGATAALFIASTLISVTGAFAKTALKEMLGPDSHTSLPKKIERDVRHLAEYMVNTAALYLLIGGLLVALIWNGEDWPTAVSVSILLTGFIALLERSFVQYERMTHSRQILSSLELLRLDFLTSDRMEDKVIMEKIRAIRGLPPIADVAASAESP